MVSEVFARALELKEKFDDAWSAGDAKAIEVAMVALLEFVRETGFSRADFVGSK